MIHILKNNCNLRVLIRIKWSGNIVSLLPLSVGNTDNDYQVVRSEIFTPSCYVHVLNQIQQATQPLFHDDRHTTEQCGYYTSCVIVTETALTCTTERRPVIITRRLGSWVNARDPAITLNTAYTNKPNADTRSRMSFRSLCSSARNLRLWTLSVHRNTNTGINLCIV